MPVAKPLLPDADSIYPYLKRIDSHRFYTNGGPLLMEFENQLANAFFTNVKCIATCSNATIAIAQALYASTFGNDGRETKHGDLCLMPSWTFTATPASANLIGLEPFFLDVDSGTWALRAEDTLNTARRLEGEGKKIAAVVLTSPFGALPNFKEWEEFSKASDIPVVIDAAASFDSIMSTRKLEQNKLSTIPTVISLHATKTFGIGEGAFLLSSNEEFLLRFRQLGNFGFQGKRVSIIPGWNSKLSEYSAAVGLAHFKDWERLRNEWITLKTEFRKQTEILKPEFKTDLLPVNGDWVSPYGLISLNSGNQNQVNHLVTEMGARGFEIRQWWGNGCHVQAAYEHCGRESLATTEMLSTSVLGMPFWLGIDLNELEFAMSSLRDLVYQISKSS